MDKTEIQEPWLGTKNQDSIVGTRIKYTPTWIKNGENLTSIEISTIGSRTENNKTQLVLKFQWQGLELKLSSQSKTYVPFKFMT